MGWVLLEVCLSGVCVCIWFSGLDFGLGLGGLVVFVFDVVVLFWVFGLCLWLCVGGLVVVWVIGGFGVGGLYDSCLNSLVVLRGCWSCFVLYLFW